MAGHKTWAIGEEVVQTDLQGFLADQIVAVFTNTAARTSGWPTPPVGALSELLSNPGALYYWNGAAWSQLGSGGEVAHFEQPSDVGIPGTLSYMGFGLGSLPMIAGRIYRIDFYYQVNHAAVSNIQVQLRTGAQGSEGAHSNILQRQVSQRAAGSFESYFLTGRYVAAATGSGTTVSVWASTTGTATFVQGGSAFTQLRAFDVGST